MPVLSNAASNVATNGSSSAPVDEAAVATGAAPEIESGTDRSDQSAGPDDGLAPDDRRRRRWPWVVAGLGVAGVAAVGLATAGGDDGGVVDDAAPRTVRTAVAEQRDLVEFDELDGRMVFADTVSAVSATDGVVTGVVDAGTLIARGDIAYEINGAPVTVFYGELPLYRPLTLGDTGDDVAVLQANLASLGYHTVADDDGNMTDTEFVVDGVYGDATVEAVERWQEDLGVEVTGLVEPASVLVLDGASNVSSVAVEVGSPVTSGSPVLELDPVEAVTTGHAEHFGDIEMVASPGTTLASGDVLYAVDDRAVVAVVSDETFERDLEEGVDADIDVFVLESMLAELGYDADGELEVDDEFTESTTTALTEFEEDLAEAYDGSSADGVFSLDEFIVVEPGTIVGMIASYDSEVIASGSELWSLSTQGSRRIVETAIAVEDQLGIVEGSVLDVRFPDGSVSSGVVVEVASSSQVDPADPDAGATLAVEIELATVPDAVADLNELDVEVLVVNELAAGATVVPASALLATGDGGFAVEAITTTGTTIVPVDVGLFSDGLVEVTGLPVGAEVVVP